MAAQNRIAELEIRLAAVERRLDVLEGSAGAKAAAAERVAAEPSLGDSVVANASTHIGRVLLIFGGAFLLRAMTDFKFVPVPIGLLMGAAYAVFWLALAYRRGAVQSRRAAAAFFGGTSTLLALPLLVESITKFSLLTGMQGLVALSVYFVLAMLVAVQRNLRSLAWLVTAGSTVTACAIFIAAHEAMAPVVVLAGIGLLALWAVYRSGWMGLQWLGALGASVGVIALMTVSQSERWTVGPRAAALAAIAVLLAYLLAFALRTQWRVADIGLFEACQTCLAGIIAFLAVRSAATAGELSLFATGLPTTALGVAAYALALSPRSRSERRQNFYYYSTLGLVLVVAGTAMILPSAAAATSWALLAMLLAVSSGRTGWVSLSLQCTALIVICGVGSGLLLAGLHALAGNATATWPLFSLVQAGIAAVTVACLFIPVAQSSPRWGTLAGLPQLLVLALSVWEVGGLMVAYVAPVLAGAGGPEVNEGLLAALRTAVLSSAAVTLALSSRYRRWPEARWLVYPVLIVVAIKLFAEDFPHGQPATLFVALAFVGGALIAVARLLRRGPAPLQGA